MKSSYKVALIAGVLLLAVVVIYFNRPAGHDVRESGTDGGGGAGTSAGTAAHSTTPSGETRWGSGTSGSTSGRYAAAGSAGAASTSSGPSRNTSGEAPPPSGLFGSGAGSAGIAPPAGSASTGSYVPPASDTEAAAALDRAARPPEPAPIRTPDPEPAISRALPPVTTGAKTYVIRSGDTFASIAEDLYGNEDRWADIAQANPRVEPTKLKVGQTIRLPDATAGASDAGSGSGAAAGSGVAGRGSADAAGRFQYTVRPGDTLSTIAAQYYGDRTLWRVIYNANKAALRNDPDRLESGIKLVIPPAPQRASQPVRGGRGR